MPSATEGLPTATQLDLVVFFAIALGLALLVGLAEIASAYKDKPQPWRAVINPWAIPLYLLYLLLTFLIGMILFEHAVIQSNWTAAIMLGILGPTLFKTQVKLFKPLAGDKNALNANVELIVQGVQDFCFAQINASLADQHFELKRKVAQLPQEKLTDTLRILYSGDEFQNVVQPLIDDIQQQDPNALGPVLVELIAKRDSARLETLLKM